MLKSLVVPGVRVLPGKAVAKREGAVSIFAAPLFFSPSPCFSAADTSSKINSPVPRHRSPTRSSPAPFSLRPRSRSWRSFSIQLTVTVRTRTTFVRTSPAPTGAGPTWLAHRATRLAASTTAHACPITVATSIECAYAPDSKVDTWLGGKRLAWRRKSTRAE
jgi:hypothetical protein